MVCRTLSNGSPTSCHSLSWLLFTVWPEWLTPCQTEHPWFVPSAAVTSGNKSEWWSLITSNCLLKFLGRTSQDLYTIYQNPNISFSQNLLGVAQHGGAWPCASSLCTKCRLSKSRQRSSPSASTRLWSAPWRVGRLYLSFIHIGWKLSRIFSTRTGWHERYS